MIFKKKNNMTVLIFHNMMINLIGIVTKQLTVAGLKFQLKNNLF